MFRLDAKVAVVTGAGQGMGFGIARALARQGARVVVNDIDSTRAAAAAAEVRASGGQASAAAFDVTAGGAVAESLDRIAHEVGPVDILVNNAGNAGAQLMQLKQFTDMTPADWEPYLAVNLMGVLHCTHAVVGGMCARGWGRVITISSEAGRQGLAIGASLYGAAKAGAASFMRHLSQEVAAHGVTANVIALGLMNNVPEEFTQPLVQSIPVGRLGTPEDVGAAVVFLASEEASWITGATLALNGGAVAI